MKSPIVVVMGVSGSGKTTIGARLAREEGWSFQEGDALHPPASVAKMRQGVPLDDDDRLPWLRAIAGVIDRWRAEAAPGVIACSALKRGYRDIIIGKRSGVFLVYLKGSPALIGERIAARKGHFMPAGLLESQFTTLEEPGRDEHPIVVGVGPSPERIVDSIMRTLFQRQRGRKPREEQLRET